MKDSHSFSASSLCSSSWQLLSNHPQRSFVIYTNHSSAIIDISGTSHAVPVWFAYCCFGRILPCIIESCIQICVFFVFHLYCFVLIDFFDSDESFVIWWLISVFYSFSIVPIAWIVLMLDLQTRLDPDQQFSIYRSFIAHYSIFNYRFASCSIYCSIIASLQLMKNSSAFSLIWLDQFDDESASEKQCCQCSVHIRYIINKEFNRILR